MILSPFTLTVFALALVATNNTSYPQLIHSKSDGFCYCIIVLTALSCTSGAHQPQDVGFLGAFAIKRMLKRPNWSNIRLESDKKYSKSNFNYTIDAFVHFLAALFSLN